VSGRGEAFVAGAKVVKNVTGYDLPKLMCGSWGRLAALTEVTLKVLPRGREQTTMMIEGLSPEQAQNIMARAMGSQADVAAAAHIPAGVAGTAALTGLRLEGFGPSVAARSAMLSALGGPDCRIFPANEPSAATFWQSIRDLTPLASCEMLWRIHVPPSRGCAVVAAAATGEKWLFDWAGGLVWLGTDRDAQQVRTAAAAAGGHATLIRAPADLRARVCALHPPASGVAALEARVRRAFDPAGIFETGRFWDGDRRAN
jgi:glycolate oxidase FAD binding subunit